MLKLGSQHRGEGFVYIFRSLDPTWSNRIKVGLSVNPILRSEQLFTTGVAYPYVPYHAWAVSDMKLAEVIAHDTLRHYRLHGRREIFDVIPLQLRPDILGHWDEPEDYEIDICLETMVEMIEVEYQCQPLLSYRSVDLNQLEHYCQQRKITMRNPDNPEAYGPLFE